MSSARTDGPTTSREAAVREDRRDATAPRLSYEAFVEVGAGSTGGFEAESVDLSLDGMRLRTAYMPQLGERLVCRFDGFGGEICADAEVIWCHDAGRGGEFGIRFTNLDGEALVLLEDMCQVGEEQPEAPEPTDPSAALPGSRVRLHIQGLGSPMRARVRDSARGEVLIGSNLEFLRVGRSVELEDVERADTRVALIEHVGVELDPETNIPQLVVALSYEGGARREPLAVAPAEVVDEGAEEEDLTTAPFRVRRLDETTPEPTVIDSEREPTPSVGRASLSLSHSARPGRVAQVPALSPAAPAVAARAPLGAEIHDDEELADPAAEIEPDPPVASKMQERVGALARKLAPTLQAAGAGAKGAFGSLLKKVRDGRARAQEQKAKARTPKRTTAPPPSGALKSAGRRLIRQHRREEPVEPEVAAAPPRSDKKRAVMGALLGMMVVVGIYYASASIRDGGTDASADPALAATAAALEAPAAAPAAVPGAPIATAEVPLFGATPLSTTEPVPVPPAPGEAAEAPGADGAEDAAEEPSKAVVANLEKEWGVGEVTDPTVLRLKMDGTVEGISGTETATGFTIVVPGRKSISSAAGFKRKDNRLDTVNVVNYPDRAEITLLFKKDVPAFVARAKGKRLIIEIASAKKKGAKSKSDDKKPKKKSKKKK